METYTFYGKENPLSMQYPAKFTVKAVTFNCVEQFLMYCKACLFGDAAAAEKILKTEAPAIQRAIGRTIKNCDEKIWAKHREHLIHVGCHHKFVQNVRLQEALLSTGSSVIVEADPVDKVWGVGLASNSPKIKDRSQWNGLNLLGQALMKVRLELNIQK